MAKRCKVLVIAGGGIFGAIPAHFLGMLPTDKQTLNGIDVLSGCSIGGILAAAYAVGQSFGLIDTVFQQRAAECFTKRPIAKVYPLACPTYRNDTLDAVLVDMIGKSTVGDIRRFYPMLNFIVPALDVTNDEYLWFENITGDWDYLKLVDVAGYTSAAPSYFAGRDLNGNCVVDGGVIDVDGILTAVSEMKEQCFTPFCGMDVLVLGTGKDVDPNPLTLKVYNALGLLGLAEKFLVPYATLSNKLFSKKVCSGLGLHYFKYWNPCTTNGKLDDYKQIPSLIEQTEKYRSDFLAVWDEWLNR